MITPSDEVLLPCPFCGGECGWDDTGANVGPFTAWVECLDCGARGPKKIKDHLSDAANYVMSAWNTRPSDATAMVKEVRDALRMAAKNVAHGCADSPHLLASSDRKVLSVVQAAIASANKYLNNNQKE